MKEYINAYTGKKTTLADGTIRVDFYNGDTIEDQMICPDDNLANAAIIPWVVQEGYTLMDKTSVTDPVDPIDDLYTRDFIKIS